MVSIFRLLTEQTNIKGAVKNSHKKWLDISRYGV